MNDLRSPLVALLLTLGALALISCGSAGNAGTEPPPPDGAPDSGDPGGPRDPATPPARPLPSAGTYRASVGSDGTLADADSWGALLDHDGRHVAFTSEATNLVAGDTNGVADAFVHDLEAHATERVSVSSAGEQADGASTATSLSADGRFVVFTSVAANLVPGGAPGESAVYVRDRREGVTELVSLTHHDGAADGPSFGGRISPDGRYVVFESEATNLAVAGGSAPGTFLRDRADGVTVRLPDATFDHVAFEGRYRVEAANDDIVVRDVVTADETRVDPNAAAGPDVHDVFPFDTSLDGRTVAFHALGAGAWNVFVHDRAAGATELVSVGLDDESAEAFSFAPTLAADGRHVLFASQAADLVADDPYVGWSLFVRDRAAAVTRRVPLESGPTSLYDTAGDDISGDGRSVAFTYVASFERDGVEAGVTGVDAHPDGVEEVFVHRFDAS